MLPFNTGSRMKQRITIGLLVGAIVMSVYTVGKPALKRNSKN
jgi:hypothetical protein